MAEFPLPATALYAGLNALIMLYLATRIPRARWRARVSLGVGDDPRLQTLVRAHGNHCEYAPYGLILIGILELAGQPLWLVHALGAALTAGRFLHPISLLRGDGTGRLRVVAMSLTFFPIAVAALACLWTAASA